MDAELKQHLDAMEERLKDFTRGQCADMAGHVLDEMGRRFDDVSTRLASIDTRLKLQAGLIQGGARAMARFSEFSENSEQRWTDLALRVLAIENKLQGGAK